MVGFAINSAADAIFKCVFGTATVAEEPRDCVMVLLGLLGNVHKGNFTWNLKAFDEFQSLLNSPVRFKAGFSFQNAEF